MANIHESWPSLELKVEKIYKTYQEVGRETNTKIWGATHTHKVMILILGLGNVPP